MVREMKELNELSKKILDELVQIDKPLLVLAGPGMGKTYALAYKMKHLVYQKKVDPSQIMVITFTNEAANNMRKRISLQDQKDIYVEQSLQPSVICTMHKLGNRIIRDNYSKFGLNRKFEVLSSGYLRQILLADCAQIVGANRKDAQETMTCRQNGYCSKNDGLKCKICDEYEKTLRKFGRIDHDDQLLLPCKLLREDGTILQRERQKAKYLLVDEYQDINHAQWELIKLLSGDKPRNLFVVGDDYQSIYGFRGGDPKYIRDFEKDYGPHCIVRPLTISRRCPSNIFKGAFRMAQKYNGGYEDLLSQIKFTEDSDVYIKIHGFEHQNIEADFIAREIKELGPSYEVLILVPSVDYSFPLKRALKKRFVDFICDYDIKKTNVYLINLLLEWLKNPSDNFLLRILLQQIIDKGISDIPAKQTDSVGKEDSRAKRENALKEISNLWLQVKEGNTLYLKIKSLKNDPLFEKLVQILLELKQSYKANDISTFLPKMIEKLKVWQNISVFSEEVNSLIEEIEGLSMAGGDSSVRILTMRKAKGLQAYYVFIVGLENNILPRVKTTGEHKAEDSRLLYVSMTRAKKGLYLLHSRQRDRNITKVALNGRSEFLDSIPKEYVKEHD